MPKRWHPTRSQLAWAAFFVGCVVVLGTGRLVSKAAQRVTRERATDEKRRYELSNRLYRYFLSDVKQLQSEVCGGRSLMGRMEVGASLYRASLPGEWVDPKYAGWEISLYVGHGRVEGIRPIAPDRSGSEKILELWSTIQLARKALLSIAIILWVAGLFLIPFTGAMRPVVAQVWAAIAMVGGLCWCAAPGFAWSIRRPNREMFGVAVGLAALMVSVFVASIPSRWRSLLRCPCGYDLHGNVSGTCPECGEPTPLEMHRAARARHEHLAEALARIATAETSHWQSGV